MARRAQKDRRSNRQLRGRYNTIVKQMSGTKVQQTAFRSKQKWSAGKNISEIPTNSMVSCSKDNITVWAERKVSEQQNNERNLKGLRTHVMKMRWTRIDTASKIHAVREPKNAPTILEFGKKGRIAVWGSIRSKISRSYKESNVSQMTRNTLAFFPHPGSRYSLSGASKSQHNELTFRSVVSR